MSGLIHFILAYDIQDDTRRKALFDLLGKFGYRVQMSVVEGRITPENFVKMQCQVKRVINTAEDKVLIITLCENCRRKIIRLGTQTDLPDQNIVII